MYETDALIRALERAPVISFAGYVYRVVADKWREAPLSALGSVRVGGRFNPPNTFPLLYCADSQMTAMTEVEALFTTADGLLKGVPRSPDLMLTIDCALARVLDLTSDALCAYFGTSHEELVSSSPSRFILNARGEQTPTQKLGAACSASGSVSALKVPSALNPSGFCLDILVDAMVIGERVSLLDQSGRLDARIEGTLPVPKSAL